MKYRNTDKLNSELSSIESEHGNISKEQLEIFFMRIEEILN